MDELIAHPADILPRDLDILRSCLLRNSFRSLANDFDLSDDSILNQTIAQKSRFTHALNVSLGFRDGVADMLKIDRIVTLRR